MERREKLHEGKAKIVYRTDDPDLYIQYFKDDATAFDGKKKGTIMGKGAINNRISCHLFEMLEKSGVPTHFVERLDDNSMLVKAVEIVPLEVILRNYIAGSMSRRVGVPEGTEIPETMFELSYKRDDLGDPLLNRSHIRALRLAPDERVDAMLEAAGKVNTLLQEFFKGIGITLVDFKLEYGMHKGQLLLADEISPDTCRFWDAETGEKLDKDRFRQDMGRVEEAYEEMLGRVTSK